MKTEKIKNSDNKNEFSTKSSNKKTKDLQANKLKSKNPKKKLGMGLSSLLSKDQELASIIKSKVEQEVKSSTFKIQQPKLSNKENHRKSILNLKSKDQDTQNLPSSLPIQQLVSGKFQPRKNFEQTELEELADSIRSNGI